MKILISAILAASTLTSAISIPVAAAQSAEIIVQRDHRGDWDRDDWNRSDWDRDYRRFGHRPPPLRHRDNEDDLAIGIIGGLAAGAIVGGILNDDQPRGPRYEPRPLPPRYPPPRPRPVPEYRGDRDLVFQPWSRDWRNFCSARYRTFNPNTGTYLGNDGKWHFCTVR